MSPIETDLSRVALAVRDFLCQHDFTGEVSLPILREATLCYPERGGKALRPAILLWSAQLFNSNLSETEYLDIASAVELFHTWTLVHDDIIDQDELRRGKASVHTFVKQQYTELPPSEAARFGQNMALLAGDLQQAWVNQIILESQITAEQKLAILQKVNANLHPHLISGEAIDVEFELSPIEAISSDEVINMLTLKTGILLRFAAETGAMLGLGITDYQDARVKHLGHLIESAGIAFQLQDDLLGMFADEAKLGKPVGSDLVQGKRTMLFAYTIERLQDDEKERFIYYLNNGKQLSDNEIRDAMALIETCGAKQALESAAQERIQSALDNLATLPESDAKTRIANWVNFLVDRDM